MKKILVNNIGLKLLSVVIALFIWLLVVQENDPEKVRSFQNMQVQILNKDSVDSIGKVFEVLQKTDTVTIYVTGRSSIVNHLSSSDFTVTADLEQLNEMKTVPIKVTCSNTSIRQENIKSDPASLKISIEDKAEQEFPIKAITQGEAANGYEVGTTSVKQGDSIIIAGPQSLLSEIDKVNVPIDVTGLEQDETKTGKIKITAKNGDTFTDTQLGNLEFKTSSGVLLNKEEVNVAVSIWKIQSDIKLKANILGEPAGGYRITTVTINPTSISLAGTPAALEALNGELTLKDSISVDGVTSAVTQKVELEDTLADMKNLKIEDSAATTITVTVGIEKQGTRTISYPITRLTIKNAPKDLKLTLTPTDKLPITVAEVTKDIKDLKEDDVQASLDLENYQTEGTHTVPVEVTLPEGYEKAVPVTIVVNLEKKEEVMKVEESAKVG